MPDERDKKSRRLRTLSEGDLINLKDKDDNFLVITKIETKNVIREFIKDEFDFLTNKVVINQSKEIEKDVNRRIEAIEKSVSAYIDYKFDKLSEKICELLLTRKFDEEVDRKVKERLNKRGGF
jgi:ABC-type sulfate transport system substrate-binding protein